MSSSSAPWLISGDNHMEASRMMLNESWCAHKKHGWGIFENQNGALTELHCENIQANKER